jgi:hypothetical protein
MFKRKQSIVVAVALAALPLSANAAVNIVFNYDPTVTIATDSAFTMGVSTQPITGNSITVPNGDYFKFSVNALVTGDTNAASGGAYDQANGTTQAPLLGLSGFGIAFTNTNTSVIAPVVAGGRSTVTFPTVLQYDVSGKGNANATSGEAGTTAQPVQAGYNPGLTTGTTGFYRLTLGAGAAQGIFTGLTYQALGFGSSVISNTIPRGAIGYAALAEAGNASTFPQYITDIEGQQPGDSVMALPSLTVNVVERIPEPASAATLTIGAASLLLGRRNRLPRIGQ